ncbi:MAG: translation initiation factor IF-2 [Nanobdellota archaeon]
MAKRSPVCSVVGHVDHGKSTLLDNIRESNIVSKEAGSITQSIGASIVPLEIIKKLCGSLLESTGRDLDLPGLLFIDTPGHAAFTSLRKRGGNLADLSVVVIDINDGVQPQTEESIRILMSYKTPFVIALNKVDLMPGFREYKGEPLLKQIQNQSDDVRKKIDERLYRIVGRLNELFGITAERFDRLEDYTKQIAMVPVSAKTGLGVPEILMLLMGLAQKYLGKNLDFEVEGPAKGTVLEVKEDRGLGITIDALIYTGTLQVNDNLVIGTMGEPIVTKVKALFLPDELAEMRDNKSGFKSIKKVTAATGVKISAKGIDDVVAGMPLQSGEDTDKAKDEIKKEVDEVLIETDKEGIICKADSLGSLEALVKLFRENGVSIRRARVGEISKRDISDAESEEDPLSRVVVGFNVKGESTENVKVITSDIIYRILDDLQEWQEKKRREIKARELDNLTWPTKIEVLDGYVFRKSNPAVVGVEVLAGKLKSGTKMMKNGKQVGMVKQIQSENKSVSEVSKGKQVAVSCPNVTVCRQIDENDVLYSMITEEEFKKFKEFKEFLDSDTKMVLKEIGAIMRESNPVWGV